jgi:cytochrome c-type biogenesis protein CcmH/NrfG
VIIIIMNIDYMWCGVCSAPPDPEEWARLADMSLEQGDTPQACICYRKAIDADPSNAR